MARRKDGLFSINAVQLIVRKLPVRKLTVIDQNVVVSPGRIVPTFNQAASRLTSRIETSEPHSVAKLIFPVHTYPPIFYTSDDHHKQDPVRECQLHAASP